MIATIVGLPAWACALAALASHGGRFYEQLDVLCHFTPIYLAIGLAAIPLGVFLGRVGAWLVSLPGVLAVLASVTLMIPEFVAAKGPEPAPHAQTLTIIQFNAWGGNRKAQAAVDWLVAQHADIIVVEEGAAIADLLMSQGGYTRTCGDCAAIIYSKTRPISANNPKPRQSWKPPISVATFRNSDGEFTVVGVHRPWPTRFAKERSHRLLLQQTVQKYPRDRMIVVGDFNSTPWSYARRREDINLGLIRRTRAIFTWPAERVSHNHMPLTFPVLPIDHVYAGPGWATVQVRRGPLLGSDHLPVVVVLAPAAGSVRASRPDQ